MAKRSDKKKEPGELYTSSEMKRHMSALIEHVDDRIAGIAEQFVDFGRTLDSHTEMIGTLVEDVSVLKEDMSVVKEDVSVLKEDVSVLKTDVSVLKTDMVIVKEKVTSIEDNLKEKVDHKEFVILERRVVAVEVNI